MKGGVIMKRGFTLIELLIVIGIIVALAGAMIPMLTTTKLTAQQAKVQAELDAIKSACIMMHYDTGTWPVAGTSGAGLLTSAGGGNWTGPYLDTWAKDPWGYPYRIIDTGTNPPVISAACWGSNNATGGSLPSEADFSVLVAPNRNR